MRFRVLALSLAWAFLTTPLPAETLQTSAAPRIGRILVGTPATSTRNVQALREALAELGYTEGRDIALEIRYAEGRFECVPALLDDLLRRQVDVTIPPSVLARADEVIQ